MTRLSIVALALAAAACAGSEPGPEPTVDAGDAGVEPPPDAGFAPHVLACPPEVFFAELVAGTSTTMAAFCSITGGPPGQNPVVTNVAASAPFTVRLQETTDIELVLAITYAPTSTRAEDDVTGVTIDFTSDGRPFTTTFRARGHAGPPYTFDPPPAAVPCRADAAAPLLDEALALASLDRASFGFTEADLMESSYYASGFLDDEFVLSWFLDARSHPARAGCLEGDVAGVLDRFVAGPHPVSNAILSAARRLDREPRGVRPIDPRLHAESFDEALSLLCDYVPFGCEPATGAMPEDLGRALVPLLLAIREGFIARYDRDSALMRPHDAAWWNSFGGNGVIISTARENYDPNDASDRAYLLGVDRDALYGAAAQIAFAVELIDWSAFRGRTGVRYELHTGAGWIRVRDGGEDVYMQDNQDVVLTIDLGGNDTHLDDVATNRSSLNAVSIAIDLAGDDRYTYDVVATPYDRMGLLPADDGLRYRGDANYGNLSLSAHGRQGSAKNGIAMLFDLGGGRDRYETLIAGQGYAHQGAGVLYDDGGDDTYAAEAAAQGSAQFGIGLLLDGGGSDTYRAFSYAQGFGYTGGAGFLADLGGDDRYSCDHGDPMRGGIALYYSPQLPGTGNTSMCQGAGFGRRGSMPGTYFSGGIGVLRDAGGDDTYEASVFAQGTGYWQGTGVLSDGGGGDQYDAFWYVQGGAAHYAIGVLADSGAGHNVFAGTLGAYNMHLGAGHDYSVGALIEDGGDSEYHASQLALGASNCNGVGLFVDTSGDDAYFASSELSSGVGNTSGECSGDRPNARSMGVMIDAGGTDSYLYPAMPMFTLPSEGGSWGHAHGALASEHGAGLDRNGESGVHAESLISSR